MSHTWQITPLTGALGAEVRGLDVSQLDDAGWQALREIWLEHLVLFFPDQHLSPEAHIEFARGFGEVEVHPFLRKLDGEHPEIVVLDNAEGDRAVAMYHIDVTFQPQPPMASILKMVVLPDVGGDTIWTNQYLAYESLSAPMRDLVETLTARHTAAPFGRPDTYTEHPVVRIHPETGRKSLFVSRPFTTHICELTRSESDAVLSALYAASENPSIQCRYRWTPGTVGVWDNRCTQHFAVADYTDQRRIERVTVVGDSPVGPARRYETAAIRKTPAELRDEYHHDAGSTSVPAGVA